MEMRGARQSLQDEHDAFEFDATPCKIETANGYGLASD